MHFLSSNLKFMVLEVFLSFHQKTDLQKRVTLYNAKNV